MRPRRPSGFRKSAAHSYRLELVLEFGGPVPATRAHEVARRIVETLQLSAAPGALAELQGARLVCHDLRQMVSLLSSTPRQE